MVDLSLLQSVSYIVGALGVGVAALYYVMTLRSQQVNMKNTLETRQAQMFMNIYQQILTHEFTTAWREVFEDSQWSNVDEFQEHWRDKEFRDRFNVVGTYYEGIGVLVKEGFLNIRLVALLMCGMTMTYWEKILPVTVDARRLMEYPRFLSESEYLYNELIKYTDDHPELKTGSYKTRF